MSTSLLKGKRILITGAGRGIGRAIAGICYEQGARVALCARTMEQLQETASLLQSKNNECSDDDDDKNRILLHTVDVTQPSQVQNMLDSIAQTWHGGLDILINNAGRGQAKKGPATELDSVDLASLLNLNVVAVHTVTTASIPYLVAQAKNNDGAQIINISSKAGKVGLPNISHYVASKFALEGLTATWATELKDSHVRVNSISPGMVNTVSFPKPDDRPGVRTAESIADGLLFLMTGTNVTGHYLHADELDLVRAQGLPDDRALKPINEPNFKDSLST